MRSTFSLILLAVCAALLFVSPTVRGHGYLQGPFQPRNVVNSHWCPQCANGHGACGEGGQWLAASGASDLNGAYTTPINPLKGGDSIEFAIQLTAAHQGHFVMELCRPNGNKITHECFNTRLKRDPSDQRYSPYIPEYPELAIFQSNTCALKSLQKVRFLIPSDFGDCAHCVLRWYWQTGNSCDSHPMTTSATTTNAIRQWKSIDGCGVAITGMGSCGSNCPTRSCKNEQFMNCMDVKITSSGSGGGQLPPPVTTTSSSRPAPTQSQSTKPNEGHCPDVSQAVAAKIHEATERINQATSKINQAAMEVNSAKKLLEEISSGRV